jgi:hypothetical protein
VLEDNEVKGRFRSVDDRIEATRAQIDNVRLVLSAQLDQARRDLAVLVLRALLLSTVVVAMMCLLTIIILL